jgi:hypothetical protein
MFNRTLQVKMVKPSNGENEKADATLNNKINVVTAIGNHADRLLKNVGIGVITYVIADTLRQVLIAKAIKS